MNEFTRIVCNDIKFRRLYVCACGTKQEGDTEYAEFDNANPLHFAAFMKGIPPNPHKMPVGWSSHLGGVLKCPKCTDAKKDCSSCGSSGWTPRHSDCYNCIGYENWNPIIKENANGN